MTIIRRMVQLISDLQKVKLLRSDVPVGSTRYRDGCFFIRIDVSEEKMVDVENSIKSEFYKEKVEITEHFGTFSWIECRIYEVG